MISEVQLNILKLVSIYNNNNIIIIVIIIITV
jgi:hypothetical protein